MVMIIIYFCSSTIISDIWVPIFFSLAPIDILLLLQHHTVPIFQFTSLCGKEEQYRQKQKTDRNPVQKSSGSQQTFFFLYCKRTGLVLLSALCGNLRLIISDDFRVRIILGSTVDKLYLSKKKC